MLRGAFDYVKVLKHQMSSPRFGRRLATTSRSIGNPECEGPKRYPSRYVDGANVTALRALQRDEHIAGT
jgi:hypothetical protein